MTYGGTFYVHMIKIQQHDCTTHKTYAKQSKSWMAETTTTNHELLSLFNMKARV